MSKQKEDYNNPFIIDETQTQIDSMKSSHDGSGGSGTNSSNDSRSLPFKAQRNI